MSQQKGNILARAAAALTTGAVATKDVPVNHTADGRVQVFVDLTIADADSAVVTPQVSTNRANWYDCTSPGALTLTADGSKAFAVDASGGKYFRCTVKGTGTVAGSSCAVRFGYCERASV